ncbi:hypothetical protein SAMN02910276_03057 [Butyrivibrio sp. Su6]|uniref:DUF6077 domain-containing protein n=1 Tax=Butyrivibrio sp. Su6 TaxID=1520810 RepID=UPI00089F08CF|nr:DUF6077 domain-containing protein [Butyrivibrio sp. Su6]SEG46531.1 hypothetical protein SAMN02910276_03057 [Butyrivibrio sp. Su6]
MLQIVGEVFKLIFWLLCAPMVIGLLFNFILPKEKRSVGVTFLLGFLIYLAVFEVIAIYCMTTIMYSAFAYCVKYFLIASWILIVLGIVRACYAYFIKKDRNFIVSDKAIVMKITAPKVYWLLFFGLLAFQLVMAVVMASFDGDDAYYVVESLLAQQADVMNTILPYTGNSTSLDIRHALAVITMWIGFIAKVSGVHATIVSHSVIPLLFIPLVYLVYAQIGKVLFKDKKEMVPVFLIIVSFLMMFGNVSHYTPATFFLMRTWQGKAMVGNLVFPMIFWIFLEMYENVNANNKEISVDKAGTSSAYLWIMLALVNMLSGMCSAMGVIFGSGIIALLSLLLLIFSRNLKVIIGAFFCMIPNLIYLALYFSIWTSGM